jgi:hypothetical protein
MSNTDIPDQWADKLGWLILGGRSYEDVLSECYLGTEAHLYFCKVEFAFECRHAPLEPCKWEIGDPEQALPDVITWRGFQSVRTG